MSWSRGCTEGFKNLSNVCMISTLLAHKKSDLCKGTSVSSDLGILYPAPKIPNPNMNFKLRWRKILLLATQNCFLLEPTRIFLGIGDSQRLFLGIPLSFSPLRFTMLLLLWGTTYFPVGVILWLSYLGELHQSPKGQDFLRSPWPSRRLRIYSRLKYLTPCWLKNAT